MIIYLEAIASPTHAVPPSMYYSGWAGQSAMAVKYRQDWSRTTQGDHYANGNTYYGIKLDVGEGADDEASSPISPSWVSTRAASATVTPTISTIIAIKP